MSETILALNHETWAGISLNRPNSFSDETYLALREGLQAACYPSRMTAPPGPSGTIRTRSATHAQLRRRLGIPVIYDVNWVGAGAGTYLQKRAPGIMGGRQ